MVEGGNKGDVASGGHVPAELVETWFEKGREASESAERENWGKEVTTVTSKVLGDQACTRLKTKR